jgi:hypothetical protein
LIHRFSMCMTICHGLIPNWCLPHEIRYWLKWLTQESKEPSSIVIVHFISTNFDSIQHKTAQQNDKLDVMWSTNHMRCGVCKQWTNLILSILDCYSRCWQPSCFVCERFVGSMILNPILEALDYGWRHENKDQRLIRRNMLLSWNGN